SCAFWCLSLRARRDDVDGGPDLVGHTEHSEGHRWRGHPEITELPAWVRRRGRGEIPPIALRRHVERDLFGLALDRHVPGERERERSADREREREASRLGWN